MAACQRQLRDRVKLQNGNSTSTETTAILDTLTRVRSVNFLTNVLRTENSNDSNSSAKTTIFFFFYSRGWEMYLSNKSAGKPDVTSCSSQTPAAVCLCVLQEKLPQVEEAPPPIGLKQASASSRPRPLELLGGAEHGSVGKMWLNGPSQRFWYHRVISINPTHTW